MQHDWIPSTLGHGETMCRRCYITNREAAVLGVLNDCDAPPPEPANSNNSVEHDPMDDELPMICPVTCQPCTTEHDEFCEDYGCARKAGIDVDRDLIA